jgi:hypothetical protein
MAHGLTSGILVYYSGDYPLPGSSIAGSQRSPRSRCEVGVVDPNVKGNLSALRAPSRCQWRWLLRNLSASNAGRAPSREPAPAADRYAPIWQRARNWTAVGHCQAPGLIEPRIIAYYSSKFQVDAAAIQVVSESHIPQAVCSYFLELASGQRSLAPWSSIGSHRASRRASSMQFFPESLRNAVGESVRSSSQPDRDAARLRHSS